MRFGQRGIIVFNERNPRTKTDHRCLARSVQGVMDVDRLFLRRAEIAKLLNAIEEFYEHSLRLRRRDGSGNSLPLQIEIQDNGPGLPDEIAGDVFEPFVSGKDNGTGLGLALVSKIISDHDGWVGVDSVPGKTVFRISLPVAPPS